MCCGMLLAYNMINLICLLNVLLLKRLQIADMTWQQQG